MKITSNHHIEAEDATWALTVGDAGITRIELGNDTTSWTPEQLTGLLEGLAKALELAGGAAIAAPGGPRVWDGGAIPEDVSAVKDSSGDVWYREQAGWTMSPGQDDRSSESWLLRNWGPLTEVVSR